MSPRSLSKYTNSSCRARTIAFVAALAVALALAITATPAAQAQTLTVIHSFSGGDGYEPFAGVTMDAAGNLYGTTFEGGNRNNGTVYELSHSASDWVLNPLYRFGGGNDGYNPWGRVALAPDGTLYGTTNDYGGVGGSGTVFHLRPSPAALALWNETVIHLFTGSDGAGPIGDLTFDQAGNIYGTTWEGGSTGNGVVYELTPSSGGWTQTVLYSFQGTDDGAAPMGGVIFDKSGNLYGVCGGGGLHSDGAVFQDGTVFQLSPSESGWMEHTLYSFTGGSDGQTPIGGLIIDASGNLYGTTPAGGSGGGGTVFELTPSNGGWTFNTLYGFSGGGGPWDKLVMDAAGNLYGTTLNDGAYGYGNVFKLTRSNGGWTYTSLHDFCSWQCGDGAEPISNLVFDANGNLYGTTYSGGAYNAGTVFEVTP